MIKVATPKGTRDFLPEVMARRNYLFGVIRQVFETYGFRQIETPAMESLATLTGKYGDEGDKLIFKVLNSGNFLSGISTGSLHEGREADVLPQISEKALRYDLTVPLARFVVQHQNELSFPFRRYQIQPVWRADRPQKGRYREFYQCDVDVVGSKSLLHEVEFLQIFRDVFAQLELPVVVKLNNRKLLMALATYLGEQDRFLKLVVALDKLDKQPLEKVLSDLEAEGFSAATLEKLQLVLSANAENDSGYSLSNAFDRLQKMQQFFTGIPEGEAGLAELKTILDKLQQSGSPAPNIKIDLSLARGLDYYTGTIFEVVADVKDPGGSICGGGRYDNLTGIFGLEGMPGVGISFGADRIYDLLERLQKFEVRSSSTQVLIVNFGEQEEAYCLQLLAKLRSSGVAAEYYPEAAKLKKQFKYADDRGIPFVAMAGEDEIAAGKVQLKNMETGEQAKLQPAELIEKLSQ